MDKMAEKGVKISVMQDHAVITYKAPINGLIEDKIGVLAIVQHGGPKGYFAKPNVETFFDLTICSKTEARMQEQILINQYGLAGNRGQLLNIINSIAPKYWGLYGIK
jgi:hypothetical protein